MSLWTADTMDQMVHHLKRTSFTLEPVKPGVKLHTKTRINTRVKLKKKVPSPSIPSTKEPVPTEAWGDADGFGGVDPGKAGFVSVIDAKGNVALIEAIPLIGDDYDLAGMWALTLRVKKLAKYVVLEKQQVFADQGPVGNFSTGVSEGLWEAFLTAAGVSWEHIAPRNWKAQMGILADPVKMDPEARRALVEARKRRKHDPVAKALVAAAEKKRRDQKKKAKDKAIRSAQKMFPRVDLRANERSRVPHDGKAEALLLSVFARRRFVAK